MSNAVSHHEAAPIGGRIWNKFTVVLALLVAALVVVVAVRFVKGIGAVTNLSDGYPWGLWIAYDVVIGSALGASGFTVAFATYILNRGAYHPIVRPAILTALFGYVQAGVSVFLDIGRYWGAWHIVSPKYAQTNSVLFEVALCILAYTMVLFIEALPMVFEKLRWENARRRLERVLFLFVAIGVLLPTMHQSSLGSLLIVFGPQVNDIYQTRFLPILFLVSTIGMGLAAVVVEGTVSSVALRRPIEREMLFKLMKVGQALMVVFLVVRFADLVMRGALPGFDARPVVVVFWVETVLFAAPVLLLIGEGAALASTLGSTGKIRTAMMKARISKAMRPRVTVSSPIAGK